MTELADLHARLSAALDRIGRASEALQQRSAPAAPAWRDEDDAAARLAAAAASEAALREALEAERTTNAQLTERVRAIKERQETLIGQIERKLARAHEQLDVQGLEVQRLKRANAQLMESNRRLIEGQDGGAINKALQAEVDALRAERRAEMAEIEEIMGELRPLIGEGSYG